MHPGIFHRFSHIKKKILSWAVAFQRFNIVKTSLLLYYNNDGIMIIRVKERIKYNVHNFADDDDQAKNAIVNIKSTNDARSK